VADLALLIIGQILLYGLADLAKRAWSSAAGDRRDREGEAEKEDK